ncbi:DUF3817 domain-containing protein [uncultured Microbacterium sp.]|uniref:DUF3817 domain-containing protein n=1 Tax=uncultured Microbacterium sp. TaxID=191216 RepID=UPI00262711DE|nr:DUF3817 domain-containing protein [uncultured Microbacterium sp.]
MREPKESSFPKIRGALTFYQVASIITGVMLILLLAEMIFKYTPIHLELFAGGDGGFLWFAPVIVQDGCEWFSLFVPGGMDCKMLSTGDTAGGTNLSLMILVAHGWFYVVYLFSIFRLWSLMRWPFRRFIVLALGGVVPVLSFIMEAKISREVKTYLASREEASASATATQEAAR